MTHLRLAWRRFWRLCLLCGTRHRYPLRRRRPRFDGDEFYDEAFFDGEYD